jgi:hypothetical protein
MDNITKPQEGILVKGGQVYALDLGTIPSELIKELSNLSDETLQAKLEEIWNSHPDSFKTTYGHCKDIRVGKHVDYVTCLNCGVEVQNFKTISEWESCKQINLTK